MQPLGYYLRMIAVKTRLNKDKPLYVYAFVRCKGGFALHLDTDPSATSRCWVVTHVQSGFKMPGGPFFSPLVAASYCGKLEAMEDIDWLTEVLTLTIEQTEAVKNLAIEMTQRDLDNR